MRLQVVLVLKSFTDDRAAWFLAILKAGAASVVTTEAALEFGADMAVFGPELPFAESTYTDLRAKQVLAWVHYFQCRACCSRIAPRTMSST